MQLQKATYRYEASGNMGLSKTQNIVNGFL